MTSIKTNIDDNNSLEALRITTSLKSITSSNIQDSSENFNSSIETAKQSISVDASRFSTPVPQNVIDRLNYYYSSERPKLSLLQSTKILDSKVRDIIQLEGELLENNEIVFSTGLGTFIHNLFPSFGVVIKKGFLVETNIISKGAINSNSSLTFDLKLYDLAG